MDIVTLMRPYGAVELPPLTQTKNTTQKPKNRIVLCRQLRGVTQLREIDIETGK